MYTQITKKNKYVILFITFCIILLLIFPPKALAAISGSDYIGASTVNERGLTITEVPSLNCDSGIICDSSGKILWARRADERHSIASITKIMTALVTLESGHDLNEKFTISKTAASVGESSAELREGYQVSIYDLLCALLVHSGNDAGIALAEGLYGNVDNFVDKMNEKAHQLHLNSTRYTNPHGLEEEGHYSTASDQCILERYCMQNETFKNIVGMKEVTLDYGAIHPTFQSTNSLMNTWNPCIGIKTGYTDNAGYCLASAAVNDGINYYAVVLGCSDETQRFTDSYLLYDWAFKHYRNIPLVSDSDVIADVPLSGFVDKTFKAGVTEEISGMVFDYDGDVSVEIILKDIPDGVNIGDDAGAITWRQGDRIIQTAQLKAKETKMGPDPFTSVWTALCRFIGVFTGDTSIAEPASYVKSIEVTRVDDLSGLVIDNDIKEAIVQNSTLG